MSGSGRSWPLDALPLGTQLFGYEIEGLLGRGGFGITYRARDKIDQTFAVKECFPRQFVVRHNAVVQPTDSEDAPAVEDCLARFMREAKALMQLSRIGASGEGVVKVHTFFEANGTAYIVMEFLQGQSLDALITAAPEGIPAARLEELMPRLLHALGSVHDAGLLHRDIKPGNIILREDGRPVLIDFGAVRTTGSGHTVTFTQIYSEGYAPIEQFSGLPQGPFSDIYAFGMTCYRAIGGRSVDAFTRQQARLRGKPDPLSPAATVGAGRYPTAVLAMIDAAIEIAPDDRPQTVGALMALMSGADDTTVIGDITPRQSAPSLPKSALGLALCANPIQSSQPRFATAQENSIAASSPSSSSGTIEPKIAKTPIPASSTSRPPQPLVAPRQYRVSAVKIAGFAVFVAIAILMRNWTNYSAVDNKQATPDVPAVTTPPPAPAVDNNVPPAPPASERSATDVASEIETRNALTKRLDSFKALAAQYRTTLNGFLLNAEGISSAADPTIFDVEKQIANRKYAYASSKLDTAFADLLTEMRKELDSAAAANLALANQKIDAGDTANADILLKQAEEMNRVSKAL